MPKQHELARIGRRFGYKIVNTFLNGTVKLQIRDRLININNIAVIVPIDPKLEKISADEVFVKL